MDLIANTQFADVLPIHVSYLAGWNFAVGLCSGSPGSIPELCFQSLGRPSLARLGGGFAFLRRLEVCSRLDRAQCSDRCMGLRLRGL